MQVKIKRVYDKPDEGDGIRFLVDRGWPGLKKELAAIDLWFKAITPSTALRKWFNHDVKKWEAFRKRYLNERKDIPDQTSQLKNEMKKGVVTLVYGAKDEKHNQAVVVRDFLSDFF
jgi:uncharacterized protein YeaO (DUF488 family)